MAAAWTAPVEAIYASPFARAQKTVEPLAARLGLPIVTVDEARERRIASALRTGS
jgi:broad specificity phosphatase PhoE